MLSDSSSEVTLLCQSHFEKHLMPMIGPSSTNKTEVHSLFKLTAANDGQLSVSIYDELEIILGGSRCQR